MRNQEDSAMGNVAQDENTSFKKISVVGLGYIGLPTAAMFASRRIAVLGIDVDPSVIERINKGEVHIVEPDLDIVVRAVVSQGYLRASLTPEPAEAFLVAVPTPFKGDDHEPDLSYIKAASKAIAPVLQPGNLVVLESTSPVGATEALAGWLAAARPDLSFPQDAGEESDIRVAHCPERVLPGKVMQELVTNDRVIGGMTPACSARAVALYKNFVSGDCVVASGPRVAEMAKLTENSYRDVNIAFANEISLVCDRLEIDVWELIELANRHPRVNILRPGAGVGGHCIAVDPWFIVSSASEQARLIRTARAVNDSKPHWVIEKIQAAIDACLSVNIGKTANEIVIAFYGIAFKPDIDDLRESPALGIARAWTNRHPGRVMVIEPNINSLPSGLERAELVTTQLAVAQADVHVFLVAHTDFNSIQKRLDYLVDPVGLFTSVGK